MKPLDGIDVVSLGQIYNGPYCSLLLSYLGADVVKVEPPEGERVRQRDEEGLTPEAVMLNSSKRSITIDITTDRGKELLKSLVEKADILVENYSSGTMDRLDLGYKTLSKINPKLIYAHGSGYGEEGPYTKYPAMDLTVQSMSGIVHATGFEDGPPVKSGAQVADFMGGINLFGAVLAALYQREQTGNGQFVEAAMFDAVYPMMMSPIAATYRDRETPPRTGNRHSGLALSPYNIYTAEDGYIAIFCVNEKHWKSLTEVLERDDLRSDSRFESNAKRAQNMDEVDAIIEEWTADQSRDQIAEKLLTNGVPCGPVQTVEEVHNDPHLEQRGMVIEMEHPEFGPVRVPGLPLRLHDSDDPDIQPAPGIGEHNGEILRENLNLSDTEISELEDEGVI